jgi:hypothetical protein
MKRISLFILLVFAFPLLSFSCDLCGCFVPNETVHHGFQLGISEQFSSLSDLSLEGQILENEQNQYLKSSQTILFANYHFNERFALQLNAPFIYRSFQRPEHDSLEQGTESGLGDMLLVAYYVPFQRKNPYSQFNWKLMGGVKLPTGNSDPIAEELHEHDEEVTAEHTEQEVASGVHGHDIALGSGSWDALIGTNIFGRSGRWFYSGQLQYAIRTQGSFDYRYANDLLWYGGGGYYVSSNPNWPVGFQAVLTGEYKGEDQLGNEKTDDTAVTSVYLGPAAVIGIKQLGVAEFGIGFPLSVDNSGLQTVPKYRLRMGFTWRL